MDAANDFAAIREYIEADNPAAAIRQSNLILSAIDQLENYPRSGKKTEFGMLRQLVVPQTPYSVFYRLRPEAVVLAGIVHGAMRRPKHLRK